MSIDSLSYCAICYCPRYDAMQYDRHLAWHAKRGDMDSEQRRQYRSAIARGNE